MEKKPQYVLFREINIMNFEQFEIHLKLEFKSDFTNFFTV